MNFRSRIPKKNKNKIKCATPLTANNSSFVIDFILRNETNFFLDFFFSEELEKKNYVCKKIYCRCNESPCKLLHISFQQPHFDYCIIIAFKFESFSSINNARDVFIRGQGNFLAQTTRTYLI